MPGSKALWPAVVLACLLTLAGWSAALPATAARTRPATAEMLVPAGERVENVFLFGRNGYIAGEVTDEVVVINGNLTLTPSARIRDRVIVIGGHLNRETGAQVGKGILNIDAGRAGTNTLFAALLGVVLLTTAKFMLGLAAIIICMLAGTFLPGPSRRAAGMMQRETLKTLLLGLLGALALLSFGTALMISRRGIPLALVIIPAAAVLLIPGMTGLALLCGDVINRGTGGRLRSPTILAGIGSLPLVALMTFPLAGPIATVPVVLLALGAGLSLLRPPTAKGEDED